MGNEGFFDRITNTIKNRPAKPEPVVLNDTEEKSEPRELSKASPSWSRYTKRSVVIGLFILTLICLFLLHSLIVPMIVSALLIFYLKPVVLWFQQKLKVSHHVSVILVLTLFLIIVIGIVSLGGYSLYGQLGNFFDLLKKALDSLPNAILDFLGGSDSVLGGMFADFLGTSQNAELTQSVQGLVGNFTGRMLSFVQGFSSRIGWFFFIFGFCFFVLWEMDPNAEERKHTTIPGYEYDIEMGKYHLSMIWRRFLWSQMILFLISLVVYTILYFILGMRYAFILSLGVGIARLIPYVGAFFAWIVVGLMALFQSSTIFGMPPLLYALLVVGISFLVDKFMDGFVQPKFLADTLKVHPAAVLTAALICGRAMGFLGIFLAAPLVATIKLIFHYIFCKLWDEDPWENMETVPEPVPMKEQFETELSKIKEKCDKLLKQVKSFGSQMRGGEDHGSKGY